MWRPDPEPFAASKPEERRPSKSSSGSGRSHLADEVQVQLTGGPPTLFTRRNLWPKFLVQGVGFFRPFLYLPWGRLKESQGNPLGVGVQPCHRSTRVSGSSWSNPKASVTTVAQSVNTGARFTITQLLFPSFSAIDLFSSEKRKPPRSGGRWRKYLILLVPAVGIEPTRSQAPRDFECENGIFSNPLILIRFSRNRSK